jgi:preprotein translocase subunit SecY
MKICPNPSCPHRLRVRSAAEFYDEKTTCSDCGVALLSAPEPPSAREGGETEPQETPAELAAKAALHRRLAVTLVLPLLLLVGGPWAVLPGVDVSALDAFLNKSAGLFGLRASWGYPGVSAFALGITPVVTAFAIVEIAAASVRKWQPLRHGGPEARAKLTRAALLVALVLAAFQGFSVAQMLEGAGLEGGGLLLNPGFEARLLILMSLMAGTFLTLGVADIVQRHGLGNGVLVFAVLSMGSEELQKLAWIARDPDDLFGPLQTAFIAITAALTVAATLLILGVRWSTLLTSLSRRAAVRELSDEAKLSYRTAPPAPTERAPLPCPASGIAPLYLAGWLLALPYTLVYLNLPLVGLASTLAQHDAFPLLCAALVAAVGIALSIAFNHPANVAAMRARLGGEGAGAQALEAEAKADLRRAIGRTLVFLGAVLALGEVVRRVAVERVNPSLLVLGTAVILDIRADYFARLRSPELVSVWPEHRPYAVDVALRALAAEGIWAHAQSVHGRTMLQLFGPFAPIEIMVQRDREEDARRVLRRALKDERFTETASAGAGRREERSDGGERGDDALQKRKKKRRKARAEGITESPGGASSAQDG